VDVTEQNYSGVVQTERYCEVNSVPLIPKTGFIPDTSNFYLVSLDREGKQCELTPLVSIKPANPALAKELLDSIEARAPNISRLFMGIEKTRIPHFDDILAPRFVPHVGVVLAVEMRPEIVQMFTLNAGRSYSVPSPAPISTPLTGEWRNKPNLSPISP